MQNKQKLLIYIYITVATASLKTQIITMENNKLSGAKSININKKNDFINTCQNQNINTKKIKSFSYNDQYKNNNLYSSFKSQNNNPTFKKILELAKENNTEDIKRSLKSLPYSSIKEILNSTDEYGYSIILLVCIHNNTELFNELLQYCEDKILNIQTYYNLSPLLLATENNNEEITSKLIKRFNKNNNINNPDIHCGNTPILWACIHNNLNIVKQLLENKEIETSINPNIKNYYGENTLYWAKKNENKDLEKLLKDHCQKFNIKLEDIYVEEIVYEPIL